MPEYNSITGDELLQPYAWNVEKLEGLTVMARHLVHDMNNFITVIGGNNNLAVQRIEPDSQASGNLENIRQTVAATEVLFKKLQIFSGRARCNEELVDINDLLEPGVNAFKNSLPGKARLSVNSNPLPKIRGDRQQLVMLLDALLSNAWDATPEGSGEVQLATGSFTLDDNSAALACPEGNARGGEYCFIEVRDRGEGINPGIVSKIFDPFFTTKLRRPGMGLPVVLGVTRRHNGIILMHTEQGRGSVFRVGLRKI